MNSVSNGDQPIKRQKIISNTTHLYQPITYSSTTTRDSIAKDLPDHLMYEILLRSCAEDLPRFKSVCKDWYSLIKDRNFIKQYYDHHKGNNNSMGIVLMTATATHFPEVCNLAILNKLCDYEDVISDLEMPAEELQLTVAAHYYVRLTTCNGLVCIYREVPLVMWNPVTKESIMLSKPRIEEGREYVNACGFGYDAANNEYRVVQLQWRLSDSFLECMVLNLGTNMSWRRIQHQENLLFPDLGNSLDCPESIFADGSIYWFSDMEDILCFDVTAETFKMIPPPEPIKKRTCPHLQRRLHCNVTTTYMVELDKGLCFVQLSLSGGLMDMWMLQKDYAATETLWVKGYSIDLVCIYNPNFLTKSICVRNKKIYFKYDEGLACYDTETKKFETAFTKFPNYYNEAVAYTKSNVCLQDIVGSKCVRTVHIGKCEACRGLWRIVPKI